MSWHRLRYDNSYSRLPETFYSRVTPTPVPEPYLIHLNTDAATLIGLDHAGMDTATLTAVLSGNAVMPDHAPLAMLYAGHQFGHWVPQLGDGRAIQLAEVLGPGGGRWALQLKGAGRTPYSRGGDGRAVLRSTLREYLGGEAMHGLGVPTTRALAITGSDMEVYREEVETAAILLRMAPSFVRFGHFEVLAARGQTEAVRLLADYVIEHHYPQFTASGQRYRDFFEAVVLRTAELMAQWQAVGFMHGVMNTDNMSILGLTLDYGPYGFMEAYAPGHICNHSDHQGRYAYDRQPEVGLWNLIALAEALTSLIDTDTLRNTLAQYEGHYARHYTGLMRAKLGLYDAPRAEDAALINDLLGLMAASGSDYTNSFRALSDLALDAPQSTQRLRDEFIDRSAIDAWLQRYRERLLSTGVDDLERRRHQRRTNPKYVLRNYLAQVAIEQAQRRDYREVDTLMTLLRSPYDEHPGMEGYTQPAPAWASQMEISCSS